MDIFTYLRHKNIISLILVSVISFYILRLIDVSVDTFYPVIQTKIKTKDIKIYNKEINLDDIIKLSIQIVLFIFVYLLFVKCYF